MSTTAELDAAVAKLTQTEAKILAHYAAGESASDTARATGVDDTEVLRVIQQIGKSNRAYARTLTMAWQNANRARATPLAPADAVRAFVASTAAPVREPSGPTDGGGQATEVINRAVATGVPKLVRLADKISDLLDELEEEVERHERTKELREEAEKLEERLREVRKQLAPTRPRPVLASAAPDERPSPAAVRGWAAETGMECPARGRIPDRVLNAYRKAVASA